VFGELYEAILEKRGTGKRARVPGILDVPRGRSAFSMGIGHYVKLAKQHGKSKILSALKNLEQLNKIPFPKSSAAANKLINRLTASSKWKKLKR